MSQACPGGCFIPAEICRCRPEGERSRCQEESKKYCEYQTAQCFAPGSSRVNIGSIDVCGNVLHFVSLRGRFIGVNGLDPVISDPSNIRKLRFPAARQLRALYGKPRSNQPGRSPSLRKGLRLRGPL